MDIKKCYNEKKIDSISSDISGHFMDKGSYYFACREIENKVRIRKVICFLTKWQNKLFNSHSCLPSHLGFVWNITSIFFTIISLENIYFMNSQIHVGNDERMCLMIHFDEWGYTSMEWKNHKYKNKAFVVFWNFSRAEIGLFSRVWILFFGS